MLKLSPKLFKNSLIIFIIFVLLFSTTSFAYAVETRETEPNDTIVNATTAAVNSETVGNLSAIEDVDWYSFTIPSAGKVSLNIKHNIITGHSGAYLFKIGLYSYNTDTQIETEIFTFGARESGTSADSPNVGLAQGTYFVRISSYYSNFFTTTDYKISPVFIATTDWESEYNDSCASSNPIPLGKDMTASLQRSDDVDFFSFTVPSAGKIYVSFNSIVTDTFFSVSVGTDNNDHTGYLSVGSYYPVSKSIIGPNIGIPAGKYYIGVSEQRADHFSNTDYTISVNFTPENNRETESNSTYDIADQISTNKEYTGNLHTKIDIDWYTFTMSYAGFAKINLKHTAFNDSHEIWSCKICSIDETSSIPETDYTCFGSSGDNPASNATVKLPAGKFYIEVCSASKDSCTSRDYKISVQPFILTAPQKPKAASSSYNSIKLTWNSVSLAFGYTIYRSTSFSGQYSTVGSTTDMSWTDSGRLTGKTYYYKIKAFSLFSNGLNGGEESGPSSTIVYAKAIPSAPVSVKAVRTSGSSIKLTWSSVTGATGYCVYRLNSSTAKFERIKVTSLTSCANSGLKVNNAYQYKIIAYRTVNGANVYGNFSSIVTA